jgi:hypothetical protein
MNKLINLTPHPVTLMIGICNSASITLNSDGVARCTQTTNIVDTLNIPCVFKNVGIDISITETSFGDVEGLPESTDGTYYIVSRLVRQALPDRNDLLVPNEIIRDAAGNIIGCGSLARN